MRADLTRTCLTSARRSPCSCWPARATLSGEVQSRLARYVAAGGRLLLNGLLPSLDHEGKPVHRARRCPRRHGRGTRRGWPALLPLGRGARLGGRGRTQGSTRRAHDLCAAAVGSREPAGADTRSAAGSRAPSRWHGGAGRAVVIACDYPCDLDLLAGGACRGRRTPGMGGPSRCTRARRHPDGQRERRATAPSRPCRADPGHRSPSPRAARRSSTGVR